MGFYNKSFFAPILHHVGNSPTIIHRPAIGVYFYNHGFNFGMQVKIFKCVTNLVMFNVLDKHITAYFFAAFDKVSADRHIFVTQINLLLFEFNISANVAVTTFHCL